MSDNEEKKIQEPEQVDQSPVTEGAQEDKTAADSSGMPPKEAAPQAEASAEKSPDASEKETGSQPSATAHEDVKSKPEPMDQADHAAATDKAPEAPKAAKPQDIQDNEPKTAVGAEQKAIDGGVWDKIFNGLAKGGPLFLLLVLCVMVIPDLFSKHFYCPAEVDNVTAFLRSMDQNSWLTPIGMDAVGAAVAKWPIFYWLAALVAMIPNLTDPNHVLAITAAIGAAFALAGVWFLAQSCRFGYKAAFAAGAILLCAPLFNPLPHFIGDTALACGFTTFALAFFVRGWMAEKAYFCLPLAFILTALAGMSGGPFFLLLPLLASCCFLIWRATFKRAQALDGILGFILMLIILGVWTGWLSLNDGGDYLRSLFTRSWDFSHLWWAAMLAGTLGAMPWILTIFGVSWARVLKNAMATFKASRKDNGSALIWCALVLGAILSVFGGHFHLFATLLVCLYAVLLGKAFVNLPPMGNRFFFFLASLFLILAGTVMLCAHFETTQKLLLPMLPVRPSETACSIISSLNYLPYIAGLLILGGLAGFIFVRRYRGNGGLIYALLFTMIFCQPVLLLLAPQIAATPGNPLVSLETLRERLARQPIQPEAVMPIAPAGPETRAPETPDQTIPAMPDSQSAPSDARQDTVIPVIPEDITQPAKPATPQEEAVPQEPQNIEAVPQTQDSSDSATGNQETTPEKLPPANEPVAEPDKTPGETAPAAPQNAEPQKKPSDDFSTDPVPDDRRDMIDSGTPPAKPAEPQGPTTDPVPDDHKGGMDAPQPDAAANQASVIVPDIAKVMRDAANKTAQP